MDVAKRLGTVLKDAREVRHLTQGEVARRLGYKNQSPLSKIERAGKRATFEEVWKVTEILGISLETLQDGMEAHEAGRREEWKQELARRIDAGTGTPGLRVFDPDRLADQLIRSERKRATPEADGSADDHEPPDDASTNPLDRALLGDLFRGFHAALRFLVRLVRLARS